MERRERVRFWVLVGTNNGATLCGAGWRHRLGDLTGAFERYLDDAEVPAEAYPPLYRGEPDYALVPDGEGRYRVDPLSGAYDTGDRPEGCTDKEEELFARRFDPEEVLGKRLAVDRLLGDACEALGILPSVQTYEERFYRLGTRARKSVFLYLGGGAGSSERLAAHLAAAGAAIELYVAQRTAEVETCGMLADVETVEIGEQLDIGEDGCFIKIERRCELNEPHASSSTRDGTGVTVVKVGEMLEYGCKTYAFKGDKRWAMVMKLVNAKGAYVSLGKGIKALFANDDKAKAFFEAAIESEGKGINGTFSYRLKI